MKKLLCAMLSVMIAMSFAVSASSTTWYADPRYGSGDPFTLQYPTMEQIVAKAEELGIDLSLKDTYSETPCASTPDSVPGALSDESNENALKALNFIRYIAGLPDDVEIKEECSQLAQAGCLVNALNDSLTHFPDYPEGMDEELYQLGYTGAGMSNIAWNYKNISDAIVNAWMDDSVDYNMPSAGHRRWILNPLMKYTGFGSVSYTVDDTTCYQHAMYSPDISRKGFFEGDYVAWPAPNTPIETFTGSLFTVSLGYEYDTPSAAKVNVEVWSHQRNKKWTVNQENPEMGFFVNTNGHGIPKCIIFKVADFGVEDTLHVRITGITKNGGESAPIEYTVNLFNMSDIQTKSRYLFTGRYAWIKPELIGSSLLYAGLPEIKWESSDPSVVKVYAKGIYVKTYGEATLTGYRNGYPLVKVRVIADNEAYLQGDADGSGKVNVNDSVVIQRILANLPTGKYCDITADADGNGSVDIIDATYIRRYMARIDVPYPIGEDMRNMQ